jgi:hypothetical protein
LSLNLNAAVLLLLLLLILPLQSDWAYAVQKVEESASSSVTLPQVELQNLAGQKVVAKDVTMWRVDSLEVTPIGMAVLVKSWQRA